MKITSDVSSQIDPQVDVKKQAKLVDAAEQFEAMMMQEMLKPMRGGKDSWGGDETADSDSASDTISSFGTEAFAKAISKGGGFGIAKQVISQVKLEHQQNSEKNIAGTKVSGFRADTFK
jgi:Rod binding domain-containing protein